MNLPNKLSVLRMVIVPFILLFFMPLPLPLSTPTSAWNEFICTYGQIIALLLFIIASITDFLDGYIARKHNIISNFGKFIDPIADKLLLTSVMIALVYVGRLHAIVPILFLFRDLVVSGVRMLGASSGKVIAANWVGKWKTGILIAAIIAMMLQRILEGFAFLPALIPALSLIGNLLTVVAMVLASISVVQYIRDNLEDLKA